MRETKSVKNPLPPIFDENSKVLILGSFPSVKSREEKAYYANPGNRFWKILPLLFGESEENLPADKDGRTDYLKSHGIALSDVVECCDIEGSQDSTITNPKARDLSDITNKIGKEAIFVVGRKAEKLYNKLLKKQGGREANYLPSTSGANTRYNVKTLAEEWKKALDTFLK